MTLHSLISSLRHRSSPPRSSRANTNTESLQSRLWDVFVRMWDLGFTSFGGPPVHFQILHRRFVEGKENWGEGEGREERKWLDEQTVSLISLFLSLDC